MTIFGTYRLSHLPPNTTQFSWYGYDTNELTRLEYPHNTFNHTHNFVDPVRGSYSAHCIWGFAKWKNKNYRETICLHLEFYLVECM